jgi:ribosomal protein S24E
MELEIVKKHDNALLKRTDVTFKIEHPKEKTPQRQAIRDKIAATVGVPREGVIIQFMRSHYGTSSTEGFAKCYPTAQDAKDTEPPYLLKRHGLAEEKKDDKKAEGAAPSAPPPPAPKAEKKEAAPKPAEKPAEKKEHAPAAKPAEKPAEKKPAEKK